VAELRRHVEAAEEALFIAGAHYGVDTVAELPRVLDDLQASLAAGDGPQHWRSENAYGGAKVPWCRGQRRKDVVFRALSLEVSMCFITLLPGCRCLDRLP